MAEWSNAAVLKTARRKSQGFESPSLRIPFSPLLNQTPLAISSRQQSREDADAMQHEQAH
jgi:hypothetical protein